MELLLQLAEQSDLEQRRDMMFIGERINVSENRSVLHVALRLPQGTSLIVDGTDVVAEVHAVLDRMAAFSDRIRDGRWTGHSGKRIRNILKQANFTASDGLDPKLLEAGPEQELHQAFESVRAQIKGASYEDALSKVASLRPQVDLFFDKVLVNAKDPSVRANRLTLLSGLLTEFSTIADFSEIVTSGD